MPKTLRQQNEIVTGLPPLIVLVIEQKPGEPADPTIVRDLLGLTFSEARLAAMVGAGLSPHAAAEQLGLQKGAARS